VDPLQATGPQTAAPKPIPIASEDPYLESLRARASHIDEAELTQEFSALKQALSVVESELRKAEWHKKMQARARRIMHVLHHVAVAVGLSRYRRIRMDHGWEFHGVMLDEERPIAFVQTQTSARTLEDLDAPIPVVICKPAQINIPILRYFARDNSYKILLSEVCRP
jgi:hypothetical protein